ncbi:MAG TPA: NmrA family NAD(P)-binding protein [Candidatus Polarisedimenticolaceae bacterium]|nr:NmrA family NAD(P)-binding protein [Candidatus Polarisedimenticolaceae bacterium]
MGERSHAAGVILVMGAGGTVGGEVVRELARAGARFRAGYSRGERAAEARVAGIDAVVADYDRPETLVGALHGVDRLLLLGPSDARQAPRELGAVAAARTAGVAHVVKLSVWGAAAEAFGFARAHRQVERELEAGGPAWTFLRPNGYMQNVIRFMAASIRTRSTIEQPAGEAAISHVDARDVAAAAVAVLTGRGHGGRAYALSGPQALTYEELAREIGASLGRPIAYRRQTDAEARAALRAAGLTPWIVEATLQLARYCRDGHADRVTPDIHELTGREPLSFRSFLREYAYELR